MGLNLGPGWISIWALDGTPFWLWMDRNLGSQLELLMDLTFGPESRTI